MTNLDIELKNAMSGLEIIKEVAGAVILFTFILGIIYFIPFFLFIFNLF